MILGKGIESKDVLGQGLEATYNLGRTRVFLVFSGCPILNTLPFLYD